MLFKIDRVQGLALSLVDHSSNSSKLMRLCATICRIGAVRQTINLPPDQTKVLLRIITITTTSARWKSERRRKRISEHSK